MRPLRADDVRDGHQPVLTTPAWAIERLAQTSRYRAEHHLIAADPYDRAVAECIAWIDPANSIAVLEPVATHPDHRRQGLTRGMISFALQVIAEKGIGLAKVSNENDNTAAATLYRPLGFEPTFERIHYAA